MAQVSMVQCRCPECGHVRGEAGEGSQVRLQCRQDKIKFVGVVRQGRFVVLNTIDLRRKSMGSAGPPRFVG
jgi:hypothetical protein